MLVVEAYFNFCHRLYPQVFYRDICSDESKIANTITDPVSKTPYTYSSNIWLSYDDKKSFTEKVHNQSKRFTEKIYCSWLNRTVKMIPRL